MRMGWVWAPAYLAIFVWATALHAADCTFQRNPDEFLLKQSRIQRAAYDATLKATRMFAAGTGRLIPAKDIPRRNLIDDAIFGRLEKESVPSAALSTDEEFLRRVYLDLTGTIPTPDEIRSFVANDSEGKRDEVIDRLLYSPAFTDRWTVWLGDLLANVAFPQNFDRQYDGRNAYYWWMRSSIASEKSLNDIAWQTVANTGNSYDGDSGAVNFPLNGITANGPIQDTYDNILARTAATYLGLSHYDCLLCHNGRGHLEQVSLWGTPNTRSEAQRMAAFFSRVSMTKPQVPNTHQYYNSYNVTDRQTGGYDLNTNFGNRPDRCANFLPVNPETGRCAATAQLTPEYRVTGAKPSDGNWRAAFANFMVDDPMFRVNFANRLWKEMFGLALADPVDSLDPARLDPDNPPKAPWTFQASHPQLLKDLGEKLAERNYSLREFLKLLAQSSAYQLSSKYDGEWKLDYVPLFARHYPRRLEGEEVHDAIAKATGYGATYTVRGWAEMAQNAIQLPEPVEPRSSGAAQNFMNAFLRGNRDTQLRSQNGSMLQRLNLMNDNFVLGRLRVLVSPHLQAASKMESNEAVVEEIFLRFLSRMPTASDKALAVEFLNGARPSDRNAYIEDLAWVCINRTEFVFSY